MGNGVLSSPETARRVFADTSYFYALLNPRDSNHDRAVAISAEVAARGLDVQTTWDVVVEAVTLLRYRVSFDLARIFLTEVTPDLILLYPTDAERRLAIQVFLKRSRAMRLSLCDAISYVLVSARLDWAPCLTFDADFAALGLTIFH